MSGKELGIIGAALCFGMLAGVGAVRWRHSSEQRKSAPALLVEDRRPDGSEVRPNISVEPLDAILKEPVESRRLVALDRFCESLDAEAVRRAVESLPRNLGRREQEVLERLLERWGELEPAAAVEYILGLKGQHPTAGALRNIVDLWMQSDAESAKRLALKLEGDQATLFLPALAKALAQCDPETALAFAEQVPAARKETFFRAAFSVLAEMDAPSAAARALALPASSLRNAALDQVKEAWIKRDPAAAMDWAQLQPDFRIQFDGGGASTSFHDNWMSKWINADPAAAGEYAMRLPDERQRERMGKSVAFLWPLVGEPEEAFAYWQRLPESEAKMSILPSIVRAAPNIEATLDFVRQLPESKIKTRALEEIGESWAFRDPDGLLAWLSSTADAGLVEAMAPGALGALMDTNRDKALAFFETLRSPKARVAAVAAMSFPFQYDDPPAAAEWLLSLPPAEADPKLLQQAVNMGVGHNPVAMEQWLKTVSGPRREEVVSYFATLMKEYDPRGAAA